MTKFVACLGIAAIAMVANVVVPKSTLLVTETFHSSIFGGAFVYVDCNMSDYTEPLCRAKAGMVWTYPETVSPCTKTHKTTQ